MRSISLGQDRNVSHEKPICKTCFCKQCKCPHRKVSFQIIKPHIPLTQMTSYQQSYIQHPINPWKKPPPQGALLYRPYDYINSSYREHYRGPRPQIRQKIMLRVKSQNKNIPFDATSEYCNNFAPKKVDREKVYIKDMQYTPDNQLFNHSTTYNSFFDKKQPYPKQKIQVLPINLPQAYKFNPNTTNNNDYNQKKLSPNKSFRPVEVVAQTGPHDLNTTYRQDFKGKHHLHLYPALKLPNLPDKTYNKLSRKSVQK